MESQFDNKEIGIIIVVNKTKYINILSILKKSQNNLFYNIVKQIKINYC